MDTNCTHKNKLVRDGTSQGNRFPKALNDKYVQIDERKLTDLLAFLKKFAEEVNYYDTDNVIDGTWESFFNDNVVSTISSISEFDYKEFTKIFDDYEKEIEDGINASQNLKTQFDIVFTLLYTIEKWFVATDKKLRLRIDMNNEISATLSRSLFDAVSYYKKSIDVGLVFATQFDNSHISHLINSDTVINSYGFDVAWQRYKDPITEEAYLSWSAYLTTIVPGTVFDPVGTTEEQALYAQLFVKKLFGDVIGVYRRLSNNMDVYLKDALNNYSAHSPHFALLLSFLQLFKYAQDEQNKLKSRHHDFYLHDVLRFVKEKAVPDTAYILFKLAKGIEKHKILKDTLLSGGKDSKGKEILFKVIDETIVNTAEIAELCNIYIDKNNHYEVYASPVANSADGLGTEIETEPASWKAFGETQKGLSNKTMPNAGIGFLISSPTLLLSEGTRTIKINLSCPSLVLSNISSDISSAKLTVKLSGLEGWIEKTPAIVRRTTVNESETNNLIQVSNGRIFITLVCGVDVPAIGALDSELHDSRFDMKEAAIYFECKHANDNYLLKYLKGIDITAIALETKVDGSKGMIIQNDQLVMDASKPFMPFGPRPYEEASLMFGSKEVFNKKLSRLLLKGKWCEFPNSGINSRYANYETSVTYTSFKISRKFLKNGQWVNDDLATDLNLFKTNTSDSFELDFLNGSSELLEPTNVKGDLQKFQLGTKGGFIKVELAKNSGFAFGHDEFPKVYAQKAIGETIEAVKTENPDYVFTFPEKPYTPTIKDFTYDYTAKGQINLSSGSADEYKANDGKLYQVHPFGYKELHASVNPNESTLFPEFAHIHPSKGKLEHKGQFIIGIDKVEPGSSVNILLKVLEGSEDPELDTKEVSWFYLSNNAWKAFKKEHILSDSTKNFTSTGLLSFALPCDCSTNHHLFPGNYIYIMAAVDENTNASAKFIELSTQAVIVRYSDTGNDPQRLATPLVSGTIAKLKVKDAKVKSLTQPYASYGGKTVEKRDTFYLRTAERLRHKDRGIAIWDYERLILQEFTDIYKVKCINHSSYGYYESIEANMDSEFAPGYVSIIVIPKTNNLNAINPYEPRVTKARLGDIESFIKSKLSPHIQQTVKVINPLYELVQLDFKVAFHDKYADWGFYSSQLNTDIMKYLSPWAFENGKELTIGGQLHKSVLIDFIEEQYYVDYLKDFKVHRYINGIKTDTDIALLTPTTSRSVFATLNNTTQSEHIINQID